MRWATTMVEMALAISTIAVYCSTPEGAPVWIYDQACYTSAGFPFDQTVSILWKAGSGSSVDESAKTNRAPVLLLLFCALLLASCSGGAGPASPTPTATAVQPTLAIREFSIPAVI